jgi:hypothetical protein
VRHNSSAVRFVSSGVYENITQWDKHGSVVVSFTARCPAARQPLPHSGMDVATLC